MSNTPRMRAAQMAAIEHMTGDVYRVGCDLEIELTTANERVKRLEEELMDAKNQYAVLAADIVLYEDRGERIKRLEEALEAVSKVIGPIGKSTWVTDDELNQAWELYMKTKEAKP